MQDIVKGVRRGDQQALEDLCTQNKGLLYRLSQRYRTACERDRASSEEDLIQAGYIGLLEAARAWEPERGAWSTIAVLCVKKNMRQAVGLNGKRVRADHGAVSLDEPIGGDASRMDLLADPDAVDMDADIMRDAITREMRAAISEIEQPIRAEIVTRADLLGHSYKDISADTGLTVNQISSNKHYAYGDLRRNKRVRALAKAYSLDYESRFHAHKGVNAFNSSWSSVVEDVALWRIERLKQIEERLQRDRV